MPSRVPGQPQTLEALARRRRRSWGSPALLLQAGASEAQDKASGRQVRDKSKWPGDCHCPPARPVWSPETFHVVQLHNRLYSPSTMVLRPDLILLRASNPSILQPKIAVDACPLTLISCLTECQRQDCPGLDSSHIPQKVLRIFRTSAPCLLQSGGIGTAWLNGCLNLTALRLCPSC